MGCEGEICIGGGSISNALQELAIDSLTAGLTRNYVAILTSMALPPNIALPHPDLKLPRNSLLSKLLGDSGSDSSCGLELDGTTPSSAASVASCVNMAAIRTAVLDPTFQFVKHSPPSLWYPQDCFRDRRNRLCWRIHGTQVSEKRPRCVLLRACWQLRSGA